MIATWTVPFEDQESTLKRNSGTQACRICGQSVPRGVGVCYGCDAEMGIGDWPSRPRRLSDRPARFVGFGRVGGRGRD